MKISGFMLTMGLTLTNFLSALFTQSDDRRNLFLLAAYVMLGISIIVLKLEMILEVLKENSSEQPTEQSEDITTQ